MKNYKWIFLVLFMTFVGYKFTNQVAHANTSILDTYIDGGYTDFSNAVKDANDPNYFDPKNSSDYYTKVPKGYHFLMVRKNAIIGASEKTNGLPIYPYPYGDTLIVNKIINNNGKYRFKVLNKGTSSPGKYRYISANKELVKFIPDSIRFNLGGVADPREAKDISKSYPAITVPGVISQAFIQRDYGNPPYTPADEKRAMKRAPGENKLLAEYFKNREVRPISYYVKRHKFFDKYFGLKGSSSLVNYRKYFPQNDLNIKNYLK
ncbi:hypothetical protein MOO44_08585 [Nicoliella spurrieriana]|uniref:Uncharacterized protein n=1 Tax=Nicoliella spurrieriana TaxID=2925830 RepID=A0A976RSD2_9LACO|nr:hypothetical protein [Nicoliella spurrieriana]UQS86904.1 hypothetical protein MOO44_08585 [Nicoliella spurrieriana]